MKHLVLTQFGTPSESVALHDDRDPAPGPRDVLVRMEAAAVNPSDLLLLRGLYFARPEPPAPVGGEGVGIVVNPSDLLLLRGLYFARPEPPARRSAVKASESSWTPGRRPTVACWASG
jgi:hypothetical protein